VLLGLIEECGFVSSIADTNPACAVCESAHASTSTNAVPTELALVSMSDEGCGWSCPNGSSSYAAL
jgi:hypothetical protein